MSKARVLPRLAKLLSGARTTKKPALHLHMEHLEARELLTASPLPALTESTSALAVAAAPAAAAAAEPTWDWSKAYSNGFHSTSGLTLNGFGAAPPLAGTSLRLTDGNVWQARSAYLASQVNVEAFTSRFSFLVAPGADISSGFTFMIQGSGPTALGENSGGLGSHNVAKSVAVKFDFYNSAGEGLNSTGLYLNGADPRNVNSISLAGTGIDFHNGHTYDTVLDYNGKTLTLTISDAGNPTIKYTTSWAVNIAATVGGNTAYVGFTASTGAPISTVDVTKWAFESKGTGTGLSGTYFDNSDFTGPAFTRVDPTINFNWANGSPMASIAADTFSARWTGQIQPKYSETYTFSTTSDDGVRLWVNDQLIIDQWTLHAATVHSGTIALTAGQKYNIRMEFFENAGQAVAKLEWQSASQTREIIPASQLYSAAPPVTPPAAPTALTATAGNAQVTLKWTASSSATSYTIYRGTTANGEAATPIKTGVTGTTFTDTGLTNGTTYFYKITAVNTGGASVQSNEASAKPQVPAPAAPTGLIATAGSAQVTLKWTATAGATSYTIYRGTSANGESATPVKVGVTGTTFADTGLVNGTTYYYKITAVNAGGESARSAEVSAKPQVAIAAAPSGVTATAGNAQVTLAWTASAGATSYTIYRGTTANGQAATALKTGVTGTSFIDTTAANGTTYFYKITAVNAGDESARSAEVSAKPVAATVQTGWLNLVYTDKNGNQVKYMAFIPKNYDASKSYATILFLHGVGEGGTDGVKQTTVGLGPVIKRQESTFDYIAIFPQSASGWWGTPTWTLDLINQVDQTYNVDRKRLILTGLSAGGIGTYDLLAATPGVFAAVVPICAAGDGNNPTYLTTLASKVYKENIWSFVGDADFTYNFNSKIIPAIRAAGGNPKATVYPGVGHNSWDRAYAEASLWTWLAAQKLP